MNLSGADVALVIVAMTVPSALLLAAVAIRGYNVTVKLRRRYPPADDTPESLPE